MCLFSAVAAECFFMFSTAVLECGSWGEFVFTVQFCCALSVVKGALEHFSLLQSHFVPSPSPSIQSLAARSIRLLARNLARFVGVQHMRHSGCHVTSCATLLRLLSGYGVRLPSRRSRFQFGARIICKNARVPCFGCALNNPKWSKLTRISTMQRLA